MTIGYRNITLRKLSNLAILPDFRSTSEEHLYKKITQKRFIIKGLDQGQSKWFFFRKYKLPVQNRNSLSRDSRENIAFKLNRNALTVFCNR